MKTSVFSNQITQLLNGYNNLKKNVERREMIKLSVEQRDALVMECGALATWTLPESTGRSPKDTYMVQHPGSQHLIDWTSANNIPMTPETFDMLFKDAIEELSKSKDLFETDRVVGADSAYSLPVKTITDKALESLFADNMFRPIPTDINKSVFADKPFTVLAIPDKKINAAKYKNRLRTLDNGETSDLAVAIDFDRRVGIVYGSAYMGSLKKLIFTVMNYYLPLEGILPLHCSANEGANGHTALLLGLSGTGKTTLSADPNRALLGDDEHGWSEHGIANFENGCYAKMIDITSESEPEIWNAVMHNDHYLNHGAIIENAMVLPNGKVDFFDTRLTQNSRSSYPLTFLSNIKPSSVGGHPSTILFLTADAYGVIPPISRLDENQAMLWFLMGYTSKLAGTETGVTEPQATFSRFFGAPFMPSQPAVYAKMLGDKMKQFKSKVYLINTGWSGGKYGVGSRIKLRYTRAMVEAALNDTLKDVVYENDKIFHLNVPTSCPNVPSEILIPKNTWANKADYDTTAAMLAKKFSDQFDKAYGNHGIADAIKNECPGK
ncbi:MAG: phosphoenolpyruvate carboxykinase (ATP) [Salinivirgaceae bacterium]|nr:phosphoenolpyruvate carboxykinase (ATP) [Salinivirgaceae bacterium]MDD4746854.1 phosphoenolpyruvate carboxykinase (ATP) [Salinivirgaceae bacterium]MDY0279073.1 phosphoenolpyruvate carboxykinase (ATP) [Salinivirgaceae bacterium]